MILTGSHTRGPGGKAKARRSPWFPCVAPIGILIQLLIMIQGQALTIPICFWESGGRNCVTVAHSRARTDNTLLCLGVRHEELCGSQPAIHPASQDNIWFPDFPDFQICSKKWCKTQYSHKIWIFQESILSSRIQICLPATEAFKWEQQISKSVFSDKGKLNKFCEARRSSESNRHQKCVVWSRTVEKQALWGNVFKWEQESSTVCFLI